MAEAFKNLINAKVAREVGHHLARVWPDFDQAKFERAAITGLTELEFKARAQHLATALHQTLPREFPQAARVLQASLKKVPKPRHAHDPDKELGHLTTDETGLAGWALWAFGEYVARHGLEHPEMALQTLHAITQRFTAEFAIRPFIVTHPALCFATLTKWSDDPSAHVRRLVSEGSRPRLPWGLRLQALVQDPTPTLPLLLKLQDDPSEYVRRSVANHLNDIAKDHPGLVADWLEQHLPDAPAARRALLKHASRTLIKQGDARILEAWGLGATLRGSVTLALSPRQVAVGESLQLAAVIRSTAAKPQKLVIDYAVHHVKASGATSAKVFKGWSFELGPREERHLVRSHSMKLITTRRYHAGRHAVDLRVNGEILATAEFDLTL